MDRGEAILGIMSEGKKRTLGPGVWMKEIKTILKPARANKAGMGNNIHLRAKNVMEFQNTIQQNKRTEVERQILE